MSKLSDGLLAGAAGTALLNAVTYLDMAARGRPSSSVPEDDVEKLADRVGVSLGGDEGTASARKSGLGALMGYVTGIGFGAVYGLASPIFTRLPRPLSVALVGAGVMAATDASSAALGTTDPKTWGAADWVSDIVPHLAYGAGVVATYDAIRR